MPDKHGHAHHATGADGGAKQLHLGSIRNQTLRLKAEIGPDADGDSVGLTTDPFQLGAFLGELVESGQYPADEKTLGKLVENLCWKNAAEFLRLL